MNSPPILEKPPNPPGSGLRLRVTYPDGNETSYPLQYREYRIGSDPSSDISLDQAGEPPFPLPRPALQCILRLR
jgi:hypothetical protein